MDACKQCTATEETNAHDCHAHILAACAHLFPAVRTECEVSRQACERHVGTKAAFASQVGATHTCAWAALGVGTWAAAARQQVACCAGWSTIHSIASATRNNADLSFDRLHYVRKRWTKKPAST